MTAVAVPTLRERLRWCADIWRKHSWKVDHLAGVTGWLAEIHNATEAGVSFGVGGPTLTTSSTCGWDVVRNDLLDLLTENRAGDDWDRDTVDELARAYAIAWEACA